jgi:ABC-type amino acid transport substrate-binding protein
MRAALLAFLGVLVSTGALANDVLSRVQHSGTLRLGFRSDAPPYSFRAAGGTPAGYMVDICREIADNVKKATKAAQLKVEFVEVTAAERLEAVRDRKVDLLCDPTSVTMARREIVDFSLPTIIDGASLLYRADGPSNLADFDGKRIGVLHGTTSEETLKATLWQFDVKAEIVSKRTHEDGIAALTEKRIDAYFGDRGILAHYLRGSRRPGNLKLESQYYTFETYAVALPREDARLRLLVDATLADLYRSHSVRRIFAHSFGNVAPDEFVRALYVIHGVPK